MVEERVTNGVRIAQLFASEVSGGATPATLSVTEANPDVEPTPDGATAYQITHDDRRVARVAVQPERAFVEFRRAPDAAAEAAADAGLRARPAATRPPRTIVFLPDGVAVKRAIPVLRAVADALDRDAAGDTTVGDESPGDSETIDDSDTVGDSETTDDS